MALVYGEGHHCKVNPKNVAHLIHSNKKFSNIYLCVFACLCHERKGPITLYKGSVKNCACHTNALNIVANATQMFHAQQ